MKKRFHFVTKINPILVLISVLIFSSCNAYKKLPYLKNIDQATYEELLSTAGFNEPKILPNDIISITVNSTIVGAVTDFNLPLVPLNANSTIQTSVPSTSTSIQNYLVDKDGKINFPVLGAIDIKGLTTKEVENHIAQLIYPRYITEKPIVNVRLLNFKVSVLGEVVRPGVYESENGQMTILDALAAAGDMTIYGKRENVLLVRTLDDGTIFSHRINLQDKSMVLDKDYFYLKQNDKLYVETNKAKGNNSRFGTFETVSLSALSIIISVIAIITR